MSFRQTPGYTPEGERSGHNMKYYVTALYNQRHERYDKPNEISSWVREL